MVEEEQKNVEPVFDEYGYDISHVDRKRCEEFFTDRIAWHYIDIENRGDLIAFMKLEPYRGALLLDTAHDLRPRIGLELTISLSVRGDTAIFSVERKNKDDLSHDEIIEKILATYDRVGLEHKHFEMVDMRIDVVDI